MNPRLATALLVFAFSTTAFAQDANPAPPAGQNAGAFGNGQGQRRGTGGMAGMGGMLGAEGRGVTGTVTEAAADHFTVKTLTGETYTVQFSANTRFVKQMARPEGAGSGAGSGNGQGNGQGWQRGQRNGQNAGQGAGQGSGQNAQSGQARAFGGGGQQIKATDIKVGDAIAAMGQQDAASAKSFGAVGIVLLDPERAKQMQQMEESYGKTWIMGKVTAINDVQVTVQGSLDNAPHTFAADENTSFRQRNSPITLADIHVGDTVRADGAVKDNLFTATTVSVMVTPTDTPRVPRNGSPPPQ